MTTPESQSVKGRRVLITGSSRGIGADTATLLAADGARVVVNYRSKAPRATKIVRSIVEAGGEAIAVQADLTDRDSVSAMMQQIVDAYGGLDVLVLNASGGMETGFGDDYAMRLNRDAQVDVLEQALPLMGEGSRVVFITSHQAHFIKTTPTMPGYEPVARSKRAGEDALRARIPELTRRGIEFIVVSGDMIEGTITATLLERSNPGAIEQRREGSGGLLNVGQFAAEVAKAVTAPVPEGHIVLLGDLSDFDTTNTEV